MEKTLKLILDNLSDIEKKEVTDYLSNDITDHQQNILCPFCGSSKAHILYEETNCSPNFINSSAVQFGISNIIHMKCDNCTSLFDVYKLADGAIVTERIHDGRTYNSNSQYFNKRFL